MRGGSAADVRAGRASWLPRLRAHATLSARHAFVYFSVAAAYKPLDMCITTSHYIFFRQRKMYPPEFFESVAGNGFYLLDHL